MSLSNKNIEQQTLLNGGETPTATQSVMTPAIIAFPPVVSNNTGKSGLHHPASAGFHESTLKGIKKTNTQQHRPTHLSHPNGHQISTHLVSEMYTEWRA